MSATIEHRAAELGVSIPDDAEIEKNLQEHLHPLSERIDSPKTLLIFRNAVLTLLEIGEQVDEQELLLLLVDKEYRQGIVDRLGSSTPKYWDQTWNAAWVKEIEPLYSRMQQKIARRRSLISFWTKEWDSLPADQVKHAAEVLSA